MKKIEVSVNTWYVVEGAAGSTVINPSTNRAVATVEEGKQTVFYALTPYVLVSDDSVTVNKATFKYAPAKLKALGLIGGGESALPAGYLAAEFLETNGAQYVNIPIVCGYDAEIEMTANVLPQTFASTPGLFSNEGVSGYSASKRFSLLFSSNYYNVRADFGASVVDNHFDGIADTIKVYKLNKQGLHIDGSLVQTVTASEFSGTTTRFFARNAARISARFYKASIKTDTQKAEIIPAIDALGVPCLYDKKSKQAFYNSGSSPFVVGMTCRQALQLAKLPAGGGTLKVSLPWDAQLDKKVDEALDIAKSKGWTIEIQYQEPDANSAVYNKYAACTNKADMEAVNPNYKTDLTKDGKWVYPLPKLTNGDQLFNGVQISAVDVKEFPLVSSGYFMFSGNKKIKRFTTRMLRIAWFDRTFNNTSLEVFDYGGETLNLSSILLGFNACKNFRTFNAVFGKKMTYATQAFSECILDKPSVLRIANSALPAASGKAFTIGIHVDHETDPEVLDALALMETNGWVLTVQWNGTATAQTASTWGLRKPPIYAKLEDVKLPDGTTERFLDWGHYVTNWEANGYMEFASEEEAKEYFNIGD